MMVDTRPFQQVHEAIGSLADALQKTNQAMVFHLMAFQNANLQLTQKSFLIWIECFNQQIESMQNFQQQVRMQQEAFLHLMSSSMEISMNLFLTPFSLAHREMDATFDRQRREREPVG